MLGCRTDLGAFTGHGERLIKRRWAPLGARDPQGLLPGNGIEPGAQAVRLPEAVEPGRRDDERVLDCGGGIGWIAKQRLAVLVEGIRVPVVGRGEPVGIACHDGRDHLAVAHVHTLALSLWRGTSDGIVGMLTLAT